MKTGAARLRDTFVRGKLVSLCLPDVERDVVGGDWHGWFNSAEITELLEHGVHPVSVQQEAAVIQSGLADPNTLLLSIVANDGGELIGVISLSFITHLYRRAELGIVTNAKRFPGAALEAMALVTTHGFDRLNLQKIYSGHHEDLWKWANTTALIGYKIEGLQQHQTLRNGAPRQIILTGITCDDFYALRASRGGDILGSDATALAAKRSSVDFRPKLRAQLDEINREIMPESNESP